MTKVNQAPAQHAMVLARIALLRMFAVTLVWAGIFFFATKQYPYKAHIPTLAVLAILAIGAGFVLSSARLQRGRALVGARSERRVANALLDMRPVGLLNSTLLGAGGDADHIVLGPWLVVVETKTGWGQSHYDGKHMFSGARAIPGNPVSQVQRQACALSQLVGSYVDAVVCVVDMANPPYAAGSATVCSLADLPGVLRTLPHRLEDAQAARIYANLAALDLPAAPLHEGARH